MFDEYAKTYGGEKLNPLTNGVKKIAYPHIEDGNLIPISHPVQKSI
jgi:hypothetical protein